MLKLFRSYFYGTKEWLQIYVNTRDQIALREAIGIGYYGHHSCYCPTQDVEYGKLKIRSTHSYLILLCQDCGQSWRYLLRETPAAEVLAGVVLREVTKGVCINGICPECIGTGCHVCSDGIVSTIKPSTSLVGVVGVYDDEDDPKRHRIETNDGFLVYSDMSIRPELGEIVIREHDTGNNYKFTRLKDFSRIQSEGITAPLELLNWLRASYPNFICSVPLETVIEFCVKL